MYNQPIVVPAISWQTEDFTGLLKEWSKGDPQALDRIMSAVYGELKLLARSYLRRESHMAESRPSALVNEAFLRLAGSEVDWQDRHHFFGIAARIMRQILVEWARSRDSFKRTNAGTISFDEESFVSQKTDPLETLALDRALSRLQAIDPDKARLVELRYFVGLSIEQTAEVMGIAPASVKRTWNLARLWLKREINGEILHPRNAHES